LRRLLIVINIERDNPTSCKPELLMCEKENLLNIINPILSCHY